MTLLPALHRSSSPLLTYAGAVGVAVCGSWGVTVADARWSSPTAGGAVPTLRAPAVVVEAHEPPPSPDSLARLLVGPHRPSRVPRNETAMLLDVIEATAQLWSSAERASVLMRIAEIPQVDSSIVSGVGRAATHIPSASARAEVLRALIHRHAHAVGASRASVLHAIGSLPSTSARASMLRLFVTRPRLTQPALVDVLAQASRLSASSDRSTVLVAAAGANRIEGHARTIYVEAAVSIPSPRHRARALSAIGARMRTTEGL